MLFIVLLSLPMIVGAVGGGLITDDSSGKRKLGWTLIGVALLGVLLQIAWQLADPRYYIS